MVAPVEPLKHTSQAAKALQAPGAAAANGAHTAKRKKRVSDDNLRGGRRPRVLLQMGICGLGAARPWVRIATMVRQDEWRERMRWLGALWSPPACEEGVRRRVSL